MHRCMIVVTLLSIHAISLAAEPVSIGSRRELFVDDALVERLVGRSELRLHQPTPQNVALVTDEPWEGNATNYVTVFQDGEVRAKASPREGTAVTDGLFITSRDRRQFSVWPESFLRPGLRTRDSWFYGDTYQNWGLVETKSALEDSPTELSVYVTERTLQETGGVLRRYSLRIDGFVSLHAPLVGGELITEPLTFIGNQLTLSIDSIGINFAISVQRVGRTNLAETIAVRISDQSQLSCSHIQIEVHIQDRAFRHYADNSRRRLD